MKKLILVLAFVFASGSFVNAEDNVNAVFNNSSIERNSPSDCVKSSRSSVEALAVAFDWDIHNGGSESDFAVDVFMILYKDCLGL